MLTWVGALLSTPSLVFALAMFEYVPTVTGVVVRKITVPVLLPLIVAGAKPHVIVPVSPFVGELVGVSVPPVVAAYEKPGGSVSVIVETVIGVAYELLTVSVKVTGCPAVTVLDETDLLIEGGGVPHVFDQIAHNNPGGVGFG